MYIITVDAEKCQGDGVCVDICPTSILSVGAVAGKQVAVVSGDPEECLGCTSCVVECEHEAIAVVEA